MITHQPTRMYKKEKRKKKSHHTFQHFGDLGKVVVSCPSTIGKEASIIGGVAETEEVLY